MARGLKDEPSASQRAFWFRYVTDGRDPSRCLLATYACTVARKKRPACRRWPATTAASRALPRRLSEVLPLLGRRGEQPPHLAERLRGRRDHPLGRPLRSAAGLPILPPTLGLSGHSRGRERLPTETARRRRAGLFSLDGMKDWTGLQDEGGSTGFWKKRISSCRSATSCYPVKKSIRAPSRRCDVERVESPCRRLIPNCRWNLTTSPI